MKISLTKLKKFIKEEVSQVGGGLKLDKETKEVTADEYAETLENPVDFVEILNIQEHRLLKRLREVRNKRLKILNKKSYRGS